MVSLEGTEVGRMGPVNVATSLSRVGRLGGRARGTLRSRVEAAVGRSSLKWLAQS